MFTLLYEFDGDMIDRTSSSSPWVSPTSRLLPVPAAVRPVGRSRAPYLKATCALSRRRAVSDMAVVGAMALSTPTSARAEQPDITRYRKLGSGVILKDVVEGEAAEVREGDLVQFNYVCRRANDYFVHSTVDQFNGESRPVTLALGGEEDHITLKDYEIHHGMGLELYYN
ncbi:uncharacterized protein [Zea mays]|uniref:uncharacterized protein n=1 Tax=Zea mays TaxID=4577 RepID=UPI000C6C3BF4|nr:uncharacterized protein LOC103642566 [Zea mays]|eukprot:XP_023156949.1 uncharacterized protein LOC103642566 [Zea mays]